MQAEQPATCWPVKRAGLLAVWEGTPDSHRMTKRGTGVQKQREGREGREAKVD